MKTLNFLQSTASFLHKKFKTDLSNHTLVFPNRRAIVYFQKYLSLLETKPIWSPKCTTINELMTEFSGLQIADDITLNFELYKIYCQEKKSEETFDRFFHWGEMLLNVFDEIDKYLVDASQLFRTLASIKEIELQFSYLTDEQIAAIKQFWKSFEPEKYSQHQHDFIEIWKVLFEIYTKYKKTLSEKNLAYEGMICRAVADMCLNSELKISANTQIFFIGFNALNKCEKTLFEYFKKEKIADFFWDFDKHYINNAEHEAGFFMCDNIRMFPTVMQDQNIDFFSDVSRKIQFIGASTDIAQAKLVNPILKEWEIKETEFSERTAIVLSDENLLLPVLYSIPEEVGKINITMGYPLNTTSAYSFLEHLLDLQKTAKIKEDGTVLFYFRAVLKILNHQYLKTMEGKAIEELTEYIITYNRVYLAESELQGDAVLSGIFQYHNQAVGLTDYLLKLSLQFYDILGLNPENTTHEQEYIYCLYKGIKKINEILNQHQINFGQTVFYKLLKQALKGIKIPFEGEPLQGLQVMGILETRALDFDNLIVLSVNEGILPKSSSGSSFVPYNLRRAFDLPTIEHQDSIYGYYFYRLLQRAKNVALIYNTSSTDRSTGEMSRYMLQLKYQSVFRIEEKNLIYDISFTTPKFIEIEKSEAVFSVLEKYQSTNLHHRNSFSASALNMYLDCSLKFYFRYIAGLKEAEEVAEDIDAANFGRLLHKALELLYQPYLGKEITESVLFDLIGNEEIIDKCLLEAFREEYYKSKNTLTHNDITGQGIIAYEIIKKYIGRILKYDKLQTPFTLKELEGSYVENFSFMSNDEKCSVRLGGLFDRVDQSENLIKIIDYKTGKESRDFNSIEELFSKGNPKRCKEAFQTFYYSLIYSLKHQTLQIRPMLYYVRAMFDNEYESLIKNKSLKTHVASYQGYDSDFREGLEKLFTEIFDVEIPFSQTDEFAICKYCAYADICHR